MRLALRLIFASIALVSFAKPARADTATCVTAAEDGQRAQRAGHLLVANESFAECSAAACPTSVRDDCTKWRSDVQAQTPTIVVDAKSPDGHDAIDVTVSIDGVVVTRQLDGRGIAVDPGSHRLSFSRAGWSTASETALVKEGVKNRIITVRFKAEPDAKPDAKAALPAEPPRGHTVYPFIVGGVGVIAIVVGVVVILLAPPLPANCNADTQLCAVPNAPGTDPEKYRQNQLSQDQDRAGQHRGYPVIGGAVIASGGLALAAGVIWFLLEPTSPGRKKENARVEPWVDRNGAGLGLRGTF